MEPLIKAIELAGGVSSLARACDVVQGAVSNWKARGGNVPPEHCFAIEHATGGAVTRRDLRPDDWAKIWPELITAEFPAPQQEAA